jgi:hypothetical protein
MISPGNQTNALFARLISHHSAVLFSQNKPATNNQLAVLFLSEQTSTSHQPPAKRAGRELTQSLMIPFVFSPTSL